MLRKYVTASGGQRVLAYEPENSEEAALLRRQGLKTATEIQQARERELIPKEKVSPVSAAEARVARKGGTE